MPYCSVLPTEDETGLLAPNPLTLHYQRELNLWFGILYSFSKSCVDNQRVSSVYCLGLANKARLGRQSSNLRLSHRSLWIYNCSATVMFPGPKTVCPTYADLMFPQNLKTLRRQRVIKTPTASEYLLFSVARTLNHIRTLTGLQLSIPYLL